MSIVNKEIDDTSVAYRDELGVLNAEIMNISGRLGKLYDALETGKMSLDDLTPRIQELRHKQQQIETRKWELDTLLSDRRVELADLETVQSYVSDLRNLLSESSLMEKRSYQEFCERG